MDYFVVPVFSVIMSTEPLPTKRIRQLCKDGYEAYDQQNFKAAIRHFFQAWTLIPKPQQQYPEAGWVLTGLGDSYFRKGDHELAIEALQSATHCAEASHNPFIQLRLGQAYFESNDLNKAQSHLQQCHEHGGLELLEKEDPKFLELLEAVL